jgi:hypothetical protein
VGIDGSATAFEQGSRHSDQRWQSGRRPVRRVGLAEMDTPVVQRSLLAHLLIALSFAAAGNTAADPLAAGRGPDLQPAQGGGRIIPVNVIDGADERDSLLAVGPQLGLSAEEIARIRRNVGYVGCFLPTPSVGTGALFLTGDQIVTAGHIFFDPSGKRRSKCFFRSQDASPVMIDLAEGPGSARFGAEPPKPGSNDDFAIVRLLAPVPGADPFPVDDATPVRAGDALVVVTAHPAGMAREVDKAVPVAQGCTVRRAPISKRATSFYRTDCDATGSSSGGMHLARVGGRLVFRGITITTGPWRDARLNGAPYDEQAGSVTTALGTDAAILAAGRNLAGMTD